MNSSRPTSAAHSPTSTARLPTFTSHSDSEKTASYSETPSYSSSDKEITSSNSATPRPKEKSASQPNKKPLNKMSASAPPSISTEQRRHQYAAFKKKLYENIAVGNAGLRLDKAVKALHERNKEKIKLELLNLDIFFGEQIPTWEIFIKAISGVNQDLLAHINLPKKKSNEEQIFIETHAIKILEILFEPYLSNKGNDSLAKTENGSFWEGYPPALIELFTYAKTDYKNLGIRKNNTVFNATNLNKDLALADRFIWCAAAYLAKLYPAYTRTLNPVQSSIFQKRWQTIIAAMLATIHQRDSLPDFNKIELKSSLVIALEPFKFALGLFLTRLKKEAKATPPSSPLRNNSSSRGDPLANYFSE